MGTNYESKIIKHKEILNNLILIQAPYNKILKESQLLDKYIIKYIQEDLNSKINS